MWIKRDDLSGWGRGGAKARKLETLAGAMEAGRYTALVLVTGNVSNLVFDILPLIRQRRWRHRLLVVDHPRALPADREAIFREIRGDVEFHGPRPVAAALAAWRAWLRFRREGERPLLLLPGLAQPTGVVGNALGFLEMAEQFRAMGEPRPAAVFITMATGTTLAGFLIAAEALAQGGGPRIRVVGVPVDSRPIRVTTRVLIRWTERALGLTGRVPRSRLELVRYDERLPFARYPADLEALCARVQLEAGIQVDPIFGGKTWAVMERMMASDPALRGQPVLFWHCGYTPEWQQLGQAVARGSAPA